MLRPRLRRPRRRTRAAFASPIPLGVAALPGGGFLIADTGDNVVELVTPGGCASVVAGIGAPGNAGDGGPAQAAALNLPTRVVATATAAT